MKNIILTFISSLILFISSCGKSDPTPDPVTPPIVNKASEKTIVKFVFAKADNPSLLADFEGIISGNTIKVNIYGSTKTNLKPKITHTAASINGGVSAQDFTNPVSYTLTAEDGSLITYSVTVNSADLYMSGNEFLTNFNTAVYWKNGIKTYLTNKSRSEAKAMVMVGSDVYIAGNDGDNAAYWKNGIKNILAAPVGFSSKATGISVFNNDVYVSGSISTSSSHSAVYWKNGNIVSLTPVRNYVNFATSIFVNGVDVYVSCAEIEAPAGLQLATYYKNGIKTHLTNGLDGSSAKQIYVEGTNIYVLGNIAGFPTIWKNGIATRLNTNATDERAMIILQNDIYVAGFITNLFPSSAAYWKNDTVVKLGPTVNGEAHAIALFNGDIITAGWCRPTVSSMKATFWINETQFSFDEASEVNAMIVK